MHAKLLSLINFQTKPSYYLFTIVIKMSSTFKMRCEALFLAILFVAVSAQFTPSWTTSLYIQSKSFSVISGTPSGSGIYTNVITFSGVFNTPSLALSIPQLRVVSTTGSNFKCSYSALGPTSFLNTLAIGGSNTVVWYLQQRYFVVSLQLLQNTFQSGIYDGNPTTTTTAAGTNTLYTFVSSASLAFGFNMAQNPVCVPFLNGVNANSVDFYQLNMTCTITATTSFSISAVSHPNTQINSLTASIIAYDSTDLSAKYIYFVDYTKTTTYQGSQTVFASLPYGYFDINFIGGLSSFSMQNNIQFNASLSIPSNNLVFASATSLYDSFPQVQIRVRNCPNSYPNYNVLDSLCYTVCPSKTYLISTNFLCSPCGAYCLTCTNSLVCTTCQTGMTLVNGVCSCPLSSYLYSDTCYGCDYTCLTCTATGQYYNCLSCNSSNYRELTPTSAFNYTCSCKFGFVDVGTAVCGEICGDGKAKVDDCDDGNTVNGDGCSNTCKIQQYFICPKDTNLFSTCYFIGNVSISVVQTYKDPFSNSVSFYLQVSPWIDLMIQLADQTTLYSNGTFASVDCSTYDGKDITSNINLVYTVQYTTSMQDTYLRINLRPSSSGVFSIMPGTNVTFKVVPDNGFQMDVYKDSEYAVASGFHYACTVLSYLMLATAPLYIFGRLKWVGNMLYLSLQFQYINICILDRFTPMIQGLSWFKYLTGYNELLPFHQFDGLKYKSFLVLGYDLHYEVNVNFMVTFQVLAIVMYIIYYIFWRRNELICKKYGGDPQKTFNSTKWGKFLSFFNWQFYMFWNFFSMTNEVVSLVLSSQSATNYTTLPLTIFCICCIILAFIPLFIKRNDVPSYTKLLYYKTRGRQEQLVTLTGYALMYLLFYLARTQTIIIYYMIMVVPIVLIIYMICRKPFQSKWVRASYIINNACILITLIYYKITLSSGKNALYLPFGGFIILNFDWIFNLVVWGRQAYIICKYGGEEGMNQILDIKEVSSAGEEQINEYLKAQNQSIKNSSVLNKVLQNKTRDRLKSRRDGFIQQMDEPEKIRQQKRKKNEDLIDLERKQLQNKRKQWSKQMREMDQVRVVRERTREAMSRSKGRGENTKREIPTTKSKGISESLMWEIDNKIFKLDGKGQL